MAIREPLSKIEEPSTGAPLSSVSFQLNARVETSVSATLNSIGPVMRATSPNGSLANTGYMNTAIENKQQAVSTLTGFINYLVV